MANYIKQLKDNDGNNIYPIAYAQGGMKMDLLWTNPSPSSNFAEQTVAIDLSSYDWIIVTYLEGAGGTTVYYATVKVTTSMYSRLLGQTNNLINRMLSITSNGVEFYHGGVVSSYGTTTTQDNSVCVPYQIYGIKMSYIVPTSVHGLQYVEVE